MILKRYAITVLALTMFGAACGGSDTATEAEAVTDEPADITLSSSDLGDFIVDDGGNTLYLFKPDAQGDSTCYDGCAEKWPAVSEISTAGEGLDASLIGTTERTDGAIQATYNGWPLYYFANDAAAGDTNGQGAKDVWYVVDGSGSSIGG